MQKITFAGNPTPDRGGDYQYDDGRCCRVTIRPPTFDGDTVYYKATAYEVDAQGSWVLSSSGAPKSTPESTHTVNKSGISAGTASMAPAWVKFVPPSGVNIDPASLPEGWSSGAGAPTLAGQDGDKYCDTTTSNLYTYTQGIFEILRQAKANELLGQLGPIFNASGF